MKIKIFDLDNRIIMSQKDEQFWTKDPNIILSKPNIFPKSSMTKDEKLNALTRLAIIVAIAIYLLGYEPNICFFFLLFAILSILIVKCSTTEEGFTITPTYSSADFQQTTVSPLFAEEWSITPPAYDVYTQVAPYATFEEPLKPQNYPYGQYLTRTNLLVPGDEYSTHMLNGGTKDAREYCNSSFLRHRTSFQENMMRLYKKKLARRYKQNSCNDTYSPYHSY